MKVSRYVEDSTFVCMPMGSAFAISCETVGKKASLERQKWVQATLVGASVVLYNERKRGRERARGREEEREGWG